MRRLILRKFTGAQAGDLTAARKIIRKINAIKNLKECLLIDCEQVAVSPQFLLALLAAAAEEKIRLCGLPPHQQEYVALNMEKRP